MELSTLGKCTIQNRGLSVLCGLAVLWEGAGRQATIFCAWALSVLCVGSRSEAELTVLGWAQECTEPLRQKRPEDQRKGCLMKGPTAQAEKARALLDGKGEHWRKLDERTNQDVCHHQIILLTPQPHPASTPSTESYCSMPPAA